MNSEELIDFSRIHFVAVFVNWVVEFKKWRMCDMNLEFFLEYIVKYVSIGYLLFSILFFITIIISSIANIFYEKYGSGKNTLIWRIINKISEWHKFIKQK